VLAFVIDAPSQLDAFALVANIFRPAYGADWWAEVEAVGSLN